MTRNPDRLPKLCGADVEFANFILGPDRPDGTAREASRALLREIDAPYARRDQPFGGAERHDPQDWGRKYLGSNGGCVYIDLDHLEAAQPETLSAWDHVAVWHAMVRLVRDAQSAANARLPEGHRLHVLANNSDGLGHSYGSHLNFLLTRRAFENLFEYRLHHLLVLAAFQASSIVMTGQGRSGRERRPPPPSIVAARGFMEGWWAPDDASAPDRHSHDEALCGRRADRRRHGSPARHLLRQCALPRGALLRVGPMQLLLAMFEAEHVNRT
jgi:hypothetical protein